VRQSAKGNTKGKGKEKKKESEKKDEIGNRQRIRKKIRKVSANELLTIPSSVVSLSPRSYQRSLSRADRESEWSAQMPSQPSLTQSGKTAKKGFN
tara:strand:+ start:5 stop:289 length:285 start_codon:yes stop_codon:yes gene_type:complete